MKRMVATKEDCVPVEVVNFPISIPKDGSDEDIVVNVTIEIHLSFTLFDFFRQKVKLIYLKYGRRKPLPR